MFDVWLGDMNFSVFILIISVVIILPGQLLLCFRAKSLLVRLLPTVVLSAGLILFLLLAQANPGWTSIAFLFFAIYAGFMLFVCGIGWGIWAISKLRK